MTNKVAIFTTASNKVGYGHLKRSFNIREKFKLKNFKVDITLFSNDRRKFDKNYLYYVNDKNLIKYLKNFNFNSYKYIFFDLSHENFKNHTSFNYFKNYLCKYKNRIILIDSYDKNSLRSFLKYKILLIPYFFNYKLIEREKNCTYLLGPKFFIFNKELDYLCKKTFPKKFENVCVSLGGSDYKNLSYKILNSLTKIETLKSIKVIIGPYFDKKNILSIKKIAKKNKKIDLIFNPNNVYKIFQKCDFAITLSGITKYELLLINCIFININENLNQSRNNYFFKKKNVCFNLDYSKISSGFKSSLYNIIKNANLTKKKYLNMKNLIDNKGFERVFREIKSNI